VTLEQFGADRRLLIRRHLGHARSAAVLIDLDDVIDFRKTSVGALVLRSSADRAWADKLHVETLLLHDVQSTPLGKRAFPESRP
jgi:hypothetical protein